MTPPLHWATKTNRKINIPVPQSQQSYGGGRTKKAKTFTCWYRMGQIELEGTSGGHVLCIQPQAGIHNTCILQRNAQLPCLCWLQQQELQSLCTQSVLTLFRSAGIRKIPNVLFNTPLLHFSEARDRHLSGGLQELTTAFQNIFFCLPFQRQTATNTNLRCQTLKVKHSTSNFLRNQ